MVKAERVKQQVSHARYGRILPVNDPFIALQRDSRFATVGGSASDDTALLKAVTEGPMAALEALVAQHRNSHVNLIQAMQDAETRHSQVRSGIPLAKIFLHASRTLVCICLPKTESLHCTSEFPDTVHY